jgi:DNA-directed RNA polymerase specialized sigma24 family protein
MSPRIPFRLLAAQSDERLIALVRAGHERAFEAVVQRYRRPLLRHCRRMGLPQSRAEDVLQHTFMQAWLALMDGTEVRNLRPWLHRIAHNAAVSSIDGSSENHGHLADAAEARRSS